MYKRRARILPDDAKTQTTIIVAVISLVGAIISAVISNPEIVGGKSNPLKAAIKPEVRIEGPVTAPVGERTFYNIISENAVRAEWSIGGFMENNSPFVLDPLSSSHQIYVEPTDPTRIGDSFIIAVTVYSRDGTSTVATKEFVITE